MDIWGLGILLFQMATGAFPFTLTTLHFFKAPYIKKFYDPDIIIEERERDVHLE